MPIKDKHKDVQINLVWFEIPKPNARDNHEILVTTLVADYLMKLEGDIGTDLLAKHRNETIYLHDEILRLGTIIDDVRKKMKTKQDFVEHQTQLIGDEKSREMERQYVRGIADTLEFMYDILE